jgi:sensor histidine kinase regulating citrate/malate metabolism
MKNALTQLKTLHTIAGIILVVLIVGSFLITKNITQKVKQDETSNLFLRAGILALAIDTEDLTNLSGSEKDLNSQSYRKLKSTLENVQNLNTDTRFTYILGLRDNDQFFYVDAESVTSPDFSPPGQIYSEALDSDKVNHKNGISYIKGPYTDRWGTWFSAFAPILDQDKKVLGMVGMDVDAHKLLLRIEIVKYATMSILGLIILSALLIFIILHKQISRNL